MLSLSVTFIGGSYEASRGSRPEWPPHPGRVFNALVAQAESGTSDDQALTWLQEQPPPVVLASDAKQSTMQAFVPTNKVSAKDDTHQTYLGRTAGSRSWQRSHPERDVAHLVWEGSTPEPDILTALARLCRRVPYLGRATSPVVVHPSTEAPADDGLRRWEHPGDGSVRLRAPTPGSLALLRAAYDNDEQSRSVDRWVAYGPPVVVPEGRPEQADGPWRELLTFGFPSGRTLDGRLVVRIAIAWRSALLGALAVQGFADDELGLLHGHHDGRGLQCALLALPFVGFEHADGEVRGLGLALSPDLPARVRLGLLHVLGMDIDEPRLGDFFVPGLASGIALRHGTFDERRTLAAQRWQSGGGSRVWETALPLVLDRYPHRRGDPIGHLRAACTFAGYPEPELVEILPTSAVTGAARLRRGDLRRRREDPPLQAVHARVTFRVPVRGPVVLGHMRHLGLGLCVPSRPKVPA